MGLSSAGVWKPSSKGGGAAFFAGGAAFAGADFTAAAGLAGCLAGPPAFAFTAAFSYASLTFAFRTSTLR